MQPTNTNILFKPFPANEFHGELYVPESARQVNDRGEVWAVGSKAKIEVGTICHRVHLWGIPVIINDEILYLMDEKAILAVE